MTICVALDMSISLSFCLCILIAEDNISESHRIIIFTWDDVYKTICIVIDKYIITIIIKMHQFTIIR